MRRLAIVVGIAAVVACAPPRPPLEAWNEAWAEAQAAVPDPDAAAAPLARDQCTKLLVTTRELHGRLLPAPDLALDAAVRDWLDHAGTLGLNCPAAPEELDAYREELRELAVLTAEVNAGLAAAARSES